MSRTEDQFMIASKITLKRLARDYAAASSGSEEEKRLEEQLIKRAKEYEDDAAKWKELAKAYDETQCASCGVMRKNHEMRHRFVEPISI